MSSTSPTKYSGNPAHNPQGTLGLLAYMKLRNENDLVVYRKLRAWVAIQGLSQQISPNQEETGRTAVTLLLQRLVRAFEHRATVATSNIRTVSASDAVSGSTVNSKSISLGNARDNPSAVPKKGKSGRNPGDLSLLMLRRVRVTRMVQQAVQFIGSDVLKVLQVLEQAPSVADVAHSCLIILEKEEKMKEFYTLFCKVSNKDVGNLDENSPVYFGVFAIQALETLRSQAITQGELAYDFEFIYHKCYDNPGFQACVNALNPSLPPSAGVTPIFAADTEARNICWKLSRLFALKFDYISKIDSEAKQFRRNHIISSAATILMAADLGRLALFRTGGQSEVSPADQTSPAPKRQYDEYDGAIADFFELILSPISELVRFLTKNSFYSSEMEPIAEIDLRRQLKDISSMISALPIVQEAEKEAVKTSNSDGLSDFTTVCPDVSFLSTSCTPTKRQFILQNYRRIIHAMVMDTQRKLNLNPMIPNGSGGGANSTMKGSGGRTLIGNVLFLFPMVVGEPWGIHRDAPMITSNLLCSMEYSKPSISQKDSVGVVLAIKGNEDTTQKEANEANTKGNTVKPSSKLLSRSHVTNPFSGTTKQDGKTAVADEENPPEARAAMEIIMEDIEPPLFDDSMELNEWTLSILSLSVIKPSDTLLTYLGEHDRRQADACSCLRDIIVPVLNRAVIRIHGAVNSAQPISGRQTQLSVGRKDGQVYVNGEIDENVQLCASVVGFYYHSLECIIRDQIQRIEFLDSFNSLLQSEAFHRALLACCYSCVLKGVGVTQRMPGVENNKDCTVYFLLQTIESNPYTFLKVTEALRRALLDSGESAKKNSGSPIVPRLPTLLQQHLQTIEAQLVDSVVWAEATASGRAEGSLPLTIQSIYDFPGAWPPDVLEPLLPEELIDLNGNGSVDVRYKPSFKASSESNFLSYVLRKLLKISFFRIQAICAALDMPDDSLVHTQILVAFRFLMRHSINMLFERHVDQPLLCTIYGVCKVMNVRPEITFGKLIDAYYAVRGKEQGERSCRVIVRHVKLLSSGDVVRFDVKPVGNLIVFYNQVYLPKMHKHFFGSKSLERSTMEYRMRHIAMDRGAEPHSFGEHLATERENKSKSSPEGCDDRTAAVNAPSASVGPTIPDVCIEKLASDSRGGLTKIGVCGDGKSNSLRDSDSLVVTMKLDNAASTAEPKSDFKLVAAERDRVEMEMMAENNARHNLQRGSGDSSARIPVERNVSGMDAKIDNASNNNSTGLAEGGADPANVEAPQSESTNCVDRRAGSKTDPMSNSQPISYVTEMDCGAIASETKTTITMATESLVDGTRKESDAATLDDIVVDNTRNGDRPRRIETVPIPVGGSQLEYLATKGNGRTLTEGDMEANSAVVAVRIDENGGINFMEKRAIGSTDIKTANGSQKRTFSTMGETDTDSPC